ncbi:uncharacterized protein PAC_16991 [Phialocephala subalpina]|uniref:Uncharacterized protein n=1 Tax=Phialocephala subalpina TaxID=576137 RepID=A0A1L7XPW4_9HELO|nr:uncharacterized protein PAC_16991 [Phialocephala subalpina]
MEAGQMQEKFESEKAALKQEMENLVKEHEEELKAEIKSLEETRARLAREKDELLRQKSAAAKEAAQGPWPRLVEACKPMQAELVKIREPLPRAQEVQPSEHADLQNNLEEVSKRGEECKLKDEEIRQLKEANEQLKREKYDLKSDKVMVQHLLEDSENALQGYDDECEKLQSQLSAAQRDIQTYISTQEKLQGTLATAREQAHDRVEALEEELKRRQNEYEEPQTQLSQAQQEIRDGAKNDEAFRYQSVVDLEKAHSRFNNLQEALKLREKQFEDLQTQLSAAKQATQDHNSIHEDLNIQLSAAQEPAHNLVSALERGLEVQDAELQSARKEVDRDFAQGIEEERKMKEAEIASIKEAAKEDLEQTEAQAKDIRAAAQPHADLVPIPVDAKTEIQEQESKRSYLNLNPKSGEDEAWEEVEKDSEEEKESKIRFSWMET